MRYRKKPVVVDVFRMTVITCARREFPEWFKEAMDENKVLIWGNIEECEEVGYVRTEEGDMNIQLGDFIIKGIKGDIYPCKPYLFEANYEKAKE